MFGYKNKIIAILMVILIVLVSLLSVSFQAKVAKVSSSFASTISVARSTSEVEVVETVADIAVEGLEAGILTSIEDNLKSSTEKIYEARQKAIAEARAIARAKAQSEATRDLSSGANLNGLEAQMLNLINSVRAQNGLGQLTVVQSLTDIARTRSSDMVSRGYFSHYTPEGTTFFNILKNSGISYQNGGENLGNAAPAGYGTPDAFINAWLASPSHRDNMLRSHYRYIGVGIIDGGGRRVVTTIFLN